jgi:predicted branched-subunit amino acid permease
MGGGASGLVVVMVIFVVNLRHVLYSASLAPYLQHLKPAWKVILGYLLTDEAYAVAVTHYQREGVHPEKHWYFLGAGLTLWTSWQLSTAAGIFISTKIPQNLPIGFFLPLTFIALVVPLIKDRPSLVSALVAGIIGLLAVDFPYKTGLLLAGLCGIVAGLVVEGRKK